jgi:hypothetical protein
MGTAFSYSIKVQYHNPSGFRKRRTSTSTCCNATQLPETSSSQTKPIVLGFAFSFVEQLAKNIGHC